MYEWLNKIKEEEEATDAGDFISSFSTSEFTVSNTQTARVSNKKNNKDGTEITPENQEILGWDLSKIPGKL